MQHQTPPRIQAIDLARGAALVAMAVYHFTWDLEFFGYADPGLTSHGGWRLFARCIASSFLFLVGVSLVLAHGKGVRWPGFIRRLAMVAGAALAISVITYFAVPSGFIFFGILHQIALASVLGLAFLRLPAVVSLATAAAVVAAPYVLSSVLFDHPFLWWVGLSNTIPHSNDYVPLFPWFGAVLAGMAAAKIGNATGLFDRLARMAPGKWSQPLVVAGQHSLAFYMIHQPVLIACVWLFSLFWPPSMETPQVRFRTACEATCDNTRSEEFCAFYCACMLDRLERENALDSIFDSKQSDKISGKVQDMAAACTGETEERSGGEMP
jgi:uncharacterized membrane protein